MLCVYCDVHMISLSNCICFRPLSRDAKQNILQSEVKFLFSTLTAGYRTKFKLLDKDSLDALLEHDNPYEGIRPLKNMVTQQFDSYYLKATTLPAYEISDRHVHFIQFRKHQLQPTKKLTMSIWQYELESSAGATNNVIKQESKVKLITTDIAVPGGAANIDLRIKAKAVEEEKFAEATR